MHQLKNGLPQGISGHKTKDSPIRGLMWVQLLQTLGLSAVRMEEGCHESAVLCFYLYHLVPRYLCRRRLSQRHKCRVANPKMKTVFLRKGQNHIQPIGACFSITIMAHDALPKAVIQKLQMEKHLALVGIEAKDSINEIHLDFALKLEAYLVAKYDQEFPFRNSVAAEIVLDQIHQYAGQYYALVAACIMPNHIHMLLDFSVQVPSDWDGETVLPLYQNVPRVVGRIKGRTANLINKELNRRGVLWKKGYYDRYIRNQQHLENEKNYILNNAVKAGLVKCWNDYPFLYPKD